ncbi:(2Fe-2S)-binding protein [Pseudomarimonas salicorniae]|uniref:(2Fe-2S)-binding protein n=1 Tax=Pseudomarimonas salicorniae TaxID=2933270 RepID=UPI00249EBB2A|nr:(2Fe-2S)-binding protein [Lysobacter sp. CAU 1642]
MTRFHLNGQPREFDGDPQMPLLWFLRDHAGLTGSKYGCGIGACGACTVHLDGRAARACVVPMSTVEGRRITTIEALGQDSLHALQRAWVELDVAQCGYCQAGQIMAAADLLARDPDPDDAAIRALPNLCRCGTYPRIRAAVKRAAGLLKAAPKDAAEQDPTPTRAAAPAAIARDAGQEGDA